MTTDVFKKAENRILAKRVKSKFTNPVEDIANVRVLSSGVASVTGQVYKSETGGHRPGSVVEAVNVGTKGNAHYVANIANTSSGLDEAAIRRIVRSMLDDLLHSADFAAALPEVETPTLFKFIGEPIVATGVTSITVDVPAEAVEGDELILIVATAPLPDLDIYVVPSGWEVLDFVGSSGAGDDYGGKEVSVLFHVVGASEPASYDFEWDETVDAVHVIYCLDGTLASVYDNNQHASPPDHAETTTIIIPAMNVFSDKVLVFYCAASNGSVTVTPPVNRSELTDGQTTTVSLFVAYEIVEDVSATSSFTATQSVGANDNALVIGFTLL